jgi:hypothetical protein
MSTTMKFQVAPRIGPAMPRGARVAAAAAVALLAALQSIGDAWRRPRVASPRRPRPPTEEAQAVRELAQQYRLSDPRFADELMAAADRHERLSGA